MASAPPSDHSSCIQFSAPPRAECRRVTSCRVSPASGTKNWDNFKTSFKLRALIFLLLSQRARWVGRPWRFDSAENACFETQPPLSERAASHNHTGHAREPRDERSSRTTMTKSTSRSQVRLIASTNAIFGADEACAMLRISRDAMYRLASCVHCLGMI